MKTYIYSIFLVSALLMTPFLLATDIKYKSPNHPFFRAIEKNDIDVVKAMLQKDPQLIYLEEANEYATPLMAAAYRNHLDILKVLVQAGALLNAIDKNGNTALMYALMNPKPSKMVEFFIKRKANLSTINEENFTPIHIAVCKGHTESIKLLVKGGVSLEEKGPRGRPPLSTAAMGLEGKCIHALVSLGADLEGRDQFSMTPLMLAAFENKSGSVRALLKLGANSEAVTTQPIPVKVQDYLSLYPKWETITIGSTALDIANQFHKSSAEQALVHWRIVHP